MENKIFKQLSEKGYKHFTENTVEELDNLPLDSPDIITEFAHLCEWLRVNHSIWISVIQSIQGEGFDCIIYGESGKCGINKHPATIIESPQEAYSSAFSYVLSKLI
jgi:hypothetical protein